MRKILKCILAFALLSMVFTSTVLAEGSITVDNMSPSSETSGVTLTSKGVDSNPTTKPEVNDAIAAVQTETGTSGAKISDLASSTKSNLGLTGFSSNAVITPFIDITPSSIPTGGVKIKVKLNSAILDNAKTIKAIHVNNDGTVDKLDAEKSGTDSVVFTATSFSPFAFVIEYNVSTGSVSGSTSTTKTPVVNTAAGEVNHTNYMAYAAVASVVAVGAIVIASKKLGKNVK